MLTKRCGLVLKNGDWCCRKWGHTAQHQGSKAQARARESRRNNPEAPAQRRAAVKRWRNRNREYRSAVLAVGRARALGLPYVPIPKLLKVLGPIPDVCRSWGFHSFGRLSKDQA